MKTTVVASVENKLHDFFLDHAMEIREANKSVSSILTDITDHQGKKIVGNGDDAFDQVIDEIHTILIDLGRNKG